MPGRAYLLKRPRRARARSRAAISTAPLVYARAPSVRPRTGPWLQRRAGLPEVQADAAGQAAGRPRRRTPAHEVLGLGAEATYAEARVAYVALSKQYHPDRVAHLAPEFRELADRRMKAINRAFAELSTLLAAGVDEAAKATEVVPPAAAVEPAVPLRLAPAPAPATPVPAGPPARRRRLGRRGAAGLLLAAVATVAIGLMLAPGPADALRSTPAPPAVPVPAAPVAAESAIDPNAALLAEVEHAWNTDWVTVIRDLDTLAEREPAQPRWTEKLYVAHVAIAVELADQGQIAEAVAHLDRAVALDPSRGVAQALRANLTAGR